MEVDFDHVRSMAAPVPEPETVALWLGGLLAPGHMARRRRADRAPG